MAGILGVRLRRDLDRAGVRNSSRPSPLNSPARASHAAEETSRRASGKLLMALSNRVRRDRAHDGNIVGDGRRLRDAHRRHGRWLRRPEGHQQDARLSPSHYRNALGRVLGAHSIAPGHPPKLRPTNRPGFIAAVRRAGRDPRAYVEQDRSPAEISSRQGFDPEAVPRSCASSRSNEYKRRQAAVGIRITPRGFGSDWRYPITSAWHDGKASARRRGSHPFRHPRRAFRRLRPRAFV